MSHTLETTQSQSIFGVMSIKTSDMIPCLLTTCPCVKAVFVLLEACTEFESLCSGMGAYGMGSYGMSSMNGMGAGFGGGAGAGGYGGGAAGYGASAGYGAGAGGGAAGYGLGGEGFGRVGAGRGMGGAQNRYKPY